MVVERAQALGSWSVRASFSLHQQAQVIPCTFSSQIIYAMSTHSLRKKNNTRDISFSSQLNADARRMFYIGLFHLLNAPGTFLANIFEMDK